MNKKKIKIIFTGGGSGGPVIPLLAIADIFKKRADYDFEFLWIGTESGIEREIVEREDIRFEAIKSGKLRRYFSWKNFSDPFLVLAGFFQSLFIIKKFRPDIIIGAGAFVAVPVSYAGFFMRVRILAHQMDIRPGLANKLIFPIADNITTVFEFVLKKYQEKTTCIGNPIRSNLEGLSIGKREACQKLGLDENLPIVLVTGGGTGAQTINDLVYDNIDKLLAFSQIIHLTGAGKACKNIERRGYHCFEFLDTVGMLKVLKVADIVVSRCGMGTLSEISQLAKPSILIPMPDSHQEDNAAVFADKEAAIVLYEKKNDIKDFYQIIRSLINNENERKKLANNVAGIIKRAKEDEIIKLLNK